MTQIKGLPLNSIILFLIVILSLGGLVKYLADTEHKIISRKNKEEKKEKSEKQDDTNPIFKGFLLKNAIIAGSIAFVVGLNTRDIIKSLTETLINPLFSVDLDHDGNHDFTEITNLLNVQLLGAEFKLGQFLLKLIHYLFFIAIIYVIVILLYTKTDFIKIE